MRPAPRPPSASWTRPSGRSSRKRRRTTRSRRGSRHDALDGFGARARGGGGGARRGVLGVAGIVGWVDRYIVDGIVNVLSAWTLTLGDRLRRIQSGQAQDYVYGIALGVLLLMVWMRWPR